MSFKSLRRSRDAKSSQISTPLSVTSANPMVSKPASAKTFIPDKVIRAVDSRRSAAPQELSFLKGDFFYVTREIIVRGELWFEVSNPSTGARGIVPQSAFEEVSKNTTTPRTPSFPQTPRAVTLPAVPKVPTANGAIAPLRQLAYFAIVQYDFIAERQDELEAKAGEAITVVAQSNAEWFVAKPIGRLGGPGLIPAAFVELRKPGTEIPMTREEIQNAIERGMLPRVEAWKKATLEYKASSIPLGVIDVDTPGPSSSRFATAQNAPALNPGPGGGAVSFSPRSPNEDTGFPGDEEQTDQVEEMLPPGVPIAAHIPSFHQESGEYWFRVDIKYQPDPNHENGSLPHIVSMVLYRNYDDFYAFQLELLDTWPVEAGRKKRHPNALELTEDDRILPYMPGPADHVDDAVTMVRRGDLDVYMHELLNLADRGAEHVLRCDHVRRFLSQKPGDVVLPSTPSGQAGTNGNSKPNGITLQQDDGADRMSRSSAYSDHKSQRSFNENTATAYQSQFPTGRGSDSSYAPSPTSPSRSMPYSSNIPSTPPSSTALNSSEGRSAYQHTAQPPPTPTSQYIRIKIYHHVSDDLVAMRMSPRTDLPTLLNRVRDRLGEGIQEVRFPLEIADAPFTKDAARSRQGKSALRSDDELRSWIVRNGDKLILYAYDSIDRSDD